MQRQRGGLGVEQYIEQGVRQGVEPPIMSLLTSYCANFESLQYFLLFLSITTTSFRAVIGLSELVTGGYFQIKLRAP